MSNIKKHRPYLTVQEVNELYRLINAEVRSNPDNWTARDLESTLRKLMTANVGTTLPQSSQQSSQPSSDEKMKEQYAKFKAEHSSLGRQELIDLMDWGYSNMHVCNFTEEENVIFLAAYESKAKELENVHLYGSEEQQAKVADAFVQSARNTPKTRNILDL